MYSQFPLMVKTPASDYNYPCYVALSSTLIAKDGNDKYISKLIDHDGDDITELESEDGQKVSIESLKCKTFAEFLVALDVNNLVHNGAFFSNDNSSIEKIKELASTVKQLREENSLLKKKLKDIEKVFKQVKLD